MPRKKPAVEVPSLNVPNLWPWLFIVLLCYVVWSKSSTPIVPSPGPAPAPVVVVDSELEKIAKANPAQALKVGKLYLAMASTVERSKPAWTSQQARTFIESADVHFILGTDLAGSLPGFTNEKNRIFRDALGLDVRSMTDDDWRSFCRACRSVANSLGAK